MNIGDNADDDEVEEQDRDAKSSDQLKDDADGKQDAVLMMKMRFPNNKTMLDKTPFDRLTIVSLSKPLRTNLCVTAGESSGNSGEELSESEEGEYKSTSLSVSPSPIR